MEHRKESLANRIARTFKGMEFTLKMAYEKFTKLGYPEEQIRARIYEKLGVQFERIGRGLYISPDDTVALVEGDGRDLSFLADKSIDCIITDHPWLDKKANTGGTRCFANYETFRYTLDDFKEKARVLKHGCFLVEMIPAENETNYQYLYQLKKMAEEAGFRYYAKVPWKKGTFISNTGRKSKNTEEMMIFSLGKARNLRPDVKKDKAEPNVKHYMSGAKGMLPTEFNVQPPGKKERIHQSEKPVELVTQLLDFLTNEEETVLDQFAGSGVIGEACMQKNRFAILIEKSKENIKKIMDRLHLSHVQTIADET